MTAPTLPPTAESVNNGTRLPSGGATPAVWAIVHDLMRLAADLKPGDDGYAVVGEQPIFVLFAIAETIVAHPKAVLHQVPTRK